MTNRYDLLIQSIHEASRATTFAFLIALGLVAGWQIQNWIPLKLQEWTRPLYVSYLVLVYILLLLYGLLQ